MEITSAEMSVVEVTAHNVNRSEVRELNDLQLALVGGGIGDVIVA